MTYNLKGLTDKCISEAQIHYWLAFIKPLVHTVCIKTRTVPHSWMLILVPDCKNKIKLIKNQLKKTIIKYYVTTFQEHWGCYLCTCFPQRLMCHVHLIFPQRLPLHHVYTSYYEYHSMCWTWFIHLTPGFQSLLSDPIMVVLHYNLWWSS